MGDDDVEEALSQRHDAPSASFGPSLVSEDMPASASGAALRSGDPEDVSGTVATATEAYSEEPEEAPARGGLEEYRTPE